MWKDRTDVGHRVAPDISRPDGTFIRRSVVANAFAALAVIAVAPAKAQAPEGAATMTAAAVAESLAVLRALDGVVRERPRDAAAWFRRGMVAWALYVRDRNKPSVPGLDWTLLGRLADTSLRIAAALDSTNGAYKLMAGRFLLTSGVSITRVASYGFFNAALEAARTGGDAQVLAETAIEAGRVYWRRYDTFADRALQVGSLNAGSFCNAQARVDPVDRPASDSLAQKMRGSVLASLREKVQKVQDMGEADYLRAETHFREAFDALPSYERAFRQFAMLLAAGERWTELAATARGRIASARDDAWAWLSLGLAVHRLRQDPSAAAAAFDSGLVRLSNEERQRLDRIERIMNPEDTSRLAVADSASRVYLHDLYWRMVNPFWSHTDANPRSEFLARVTFAELRWTVEEMHVRGADSDRGDVYIRFGPPDYVAGFRDQVNITTMWAYDSGLLMCFTGQPTFATARISPAREADYYDFIRSVPVKWDNVMTVRIDSMPIQIARFRARDSVDVVIATLPPMERITQTADVAGRSRWDLWLLHEGVELTVRDSVVPSPPGIRTRTARVTPAAYLYRAEASADGARVGARATGTLVLTNDEKGFALRGFGMSDVLLATHTSASGTAHRWNELAAVPLAGSVQRNRSIDLVWETYELAESDGQARYDITIALDRRRAAAGRIAVTIAGALGRAVGREQTADRLTLRFERVIAHSDTVLDDVTLELGATPPGTYRLTVAVTDRFSGRNAARTTTLVVQ
jgi:GWxTD domain-containing protein